MSNIMDILRLYNTICGIKPKELSPIPPYTQSSQRKIMFNLNELIIYYKDNFGIYHKKRGGNEITKIDFIILTK